MTDTTVKMSAPVYKSAFKKRSLSDRVFGAMVVILSVLAFIAVAYPIYFIVIASISDSNMVSQGKVLFFPKGINFYGYSQIFKDARIWQGYLNTIIYTILGTLLNMAVTLPAAYALSRKKFKARKVIMPLFVFTMYFGGGMIPTYLLVKDLGLINTIWAMLLPGALSVYNLIITRTFMESSIPEDLYEAAILDGCTHFTFFSKIVLPLSKAVISVIFLYYMVAHWNDFFTPLLYL